MVALSVIAFSLLISYVDVKKHLIYNRHLALFAIPLIVTSETAPISIIFIAAFLALVISLLCRIGGGDLKLFCLLLFTHGALITTYRYFALFFIAISIAVLLTLLRRRSLKGSLPLAPPILAPFLYLYLDI
jgi:Flp pilus assembly protein protease CpaA